MDIPQTTLTKITELIQTIKTKISNAISTHNSDSNAHSTEMAKKENKTNKVTSWSNNVTDDNYPSEKLVYDTIQDLDADAIDFRGEGTIGDVVSGKLNKSFTNASSKNVVTDSNGFITTEDKPTLTSLSTLNGELSLDDIGDIDEIVASGQCDFDITQTNDVILTVKNPEEFDTELIYGEYVGTASEDGYLGVNYQTGEVYPVEFEKITLTVTYDDDTTGTLTLLRG